VLLLSIFRNLSFSLRPSIDNILSLVAGSATQEQGPHLPVAFASSDEIFISPAFLGHQDCITKLLRMLSGIVCNLFAGIWLRPEINPPLCILATECHKFFVLTARCPVELVKSLDSGEVLVKGELGRRILVILVHNADHSSHHFYFGGVIDHAGLNSLGLVLIELVGHRSTVEGRHRVAFEVSRLDGSFFNSGTWEITLPLRLAHEDVPELSESLASIIVEAKLPVRAECQNMHHDLALVGFKVGLSDLVAVLLIPESIPPVRKLLAGYSDFVNLATCFHVLRTELESQLEVLFPFFVIVGGQLLDGLVPDLGQLSVIDHAGLQVLFDIKVKAAKDHTSVEVGNFVLSAGQETNEIHFPCRN